MNAQQAMFEMISKGLGLLEFGKYIDKQTRIRIETILQSKIKWEKNR